MNVVVANDISELGRLSNRLTQFWAEHRLSPEMEGEVCLALEEIVVNIMRYGHPEGGKHEILVRLSFEGGLVTVAVEDDGVPFNPLEATEPDLNRPLEERSIGGLGIHLVRNLMDGVDYRREEGRNCLVMRKRVPGRA
jgi:serine/threonine-protein kinase RsbW